MPELSNYAICYDAIQRVYRNAIIRETRRLLKQAYGDDWLKSVQGVFQKEWNGVVEAANEIRVTGFVGASLVDDFDCLGVNHFHNLFAKFFNELFPRSDKVSDMVREEERRAVLRFAKEVNDYRNAMSHPSEGDLPRRDAIRLLDSACRLLNKIDREAAEKILGYERRLSGDAVTLERERERQHWPTPPPSQTVPLGPVPQREYSARQMAYHGFFTDLLRRIKARSPLITNRQRVGYDGWLSLASGRGGVGVNPAFARGDQFRVEIYISTGDRALNKHIFDQLLSQKDVIEQSLGQALIWERLDQGKDSRIYVPYHRPVHPTELDDSVLDWAVDQVVKFREVFGPRLLN